jgi:hypothetical protein
MRIAVSLWLVLVTMISLAPFDVKYELGANGRFHDSGHFFIFFVTIILVCWTAGNVSSKLLRFLGVCCVAILQEALETVIYHNRFEWRDVLIDTFGAAIALVVASVLPLVFPSLHSNAISNAAPSRTRT